MKDKKMLQVLSSNFFLKLYQTTLNLSKMGAFTLLSKLIKLVIYFL